MKPSELGGRAIKNLRSNLGWSQDEFGRKLAEQMQREKGSFSPMTISNWETGRKFPPTDTVVAMSQIFNVSTDYLLGLSTEPKSSKAKKSSDNISDFNEKITIPYAELEKYDSRPVFVSGIGAEPQWAIVDYSKSALIMKNMKIRIDPSFKYTTVIPPEYITVQSLAHHYLGLEDVKRMSDVYVESILPDPYLRGQITGWYHHSPDKTFLVNDKGMALSYEGLSITYRVVDIKKLPKVESKTQKTTKTKKK